MTNASIQNWRPCLRGVIDGIVPHPLKITALDSYTGLFSCGEKKAFGDAQLEAVADRSSMQNNVPPPKSHDS